MARLRLFAGLREAAGTPEARWDGASVGEVLDRAARAYGPGFAAGLDTAAIWVNGEPADRLTTVGESDEVAVLPPVSGGAQSLSVPVDTVRSAASALLALVLVLANLASERWFVVAVVGVAAVWVWDVFDQAERWRVRGERWPVLLAATAGAWGAYRWSSEGLGVVAGFLIVVVFVWSLARPATRPLQVVAGTMVAALVIATATGGLTLVRLGELGEDRISAFLLITVVAAVAMWAARRYLQSPVLDPHTASALGAVAAGLIAGIVWDTSLLAMVLASAGTAGALLAGRAFGSLLRTGELYLAQPLPGTFEALDAAVMAAPIYWMILALVG